MTRRGRSAARGGPAKGGGGYRALFVNIGLFAVNTVATKLITFLLVPLYTYYMNARQFGVTDMAATVVNLVMPLATLSIADATLRYAMEDEGSRRDYIATGLLVTALSCVLVLCGLPLLDLGVFGGLGGYRWLFLLSYAANAAQLFLSNVARAVDEVGAIPVASSISAFATGALAYLFVGPLAWGVEGYFWSLIAGNAAGALWYLLGARLTRFFGVVDVATVRRCLRPMLRYALPLIPNALFWWVGTSVNRFFITSMLGIASSGLFAAASKIPALLNVICGVFQQAWTLSAFQEYRRADVSAFFTRVLRVFQCGMMLSASAIVLCAPWIAGVMLRREFYASWTLVPPLIVAFYLNAMNAFYGTVYTASMRTRALFTTTVAGSAVIVGATWALLPSMGLMGACLAMIACNAVVLVGRMIGSRRLIEVRVHWATVLPSFALLCAQAAVSSALGEEGLRASAALFAVVALIQLVDLAPLARRLYARSRDGLRPRAAAVGEEE